MSYIDRDVIIQGLFLKCVEMPENCFDCPCVDAEFNECAAREHLSLPKDEYGAVSGNIPEWCPLVDADVEPIRHGRWVVDTIYPSGVKKFHCSVCGQERTVHEKYEGVFRQNYCPNCGALMDKGET